MPVDIAPLIWNRACHGDGDAPRAGDVALTALLRFHDCAMNGGVFHAIGCHQSKELHAAKRGYRYFGFTNIENLITKAQAFLRSGADASDYEQEMRQQYANGIPSDAVLYSRFEKVFSEQASAFSPVL